MNVRKFVWSDYEDVSGWWKERGWGEVPLELLPDAGFIIEDGDIAVCAGWIYEDKKAPFGMMEWIISNPEAKNVQAVKSLNLLIETISKYADEKKLTLHTSCQIKSLIKLYGRNDFQQTDTNMTNMVRMAKWE